MHLRVQMSCSLYAISWMPSTAISLPREAFCRSLMRGAYSGERYHSRAFAMVGNSSTTRRFGVQPPSSDSHRAAAHDEPAAVLFDRGHDLLARTRRRLRDP